MGLEGRQVAMARCSRFRVRSRTLACCIAAILVSFAVGCGPFEYYRSTTRKATSSVTAARAAGANRLARYDYTLSILYLRQARLEEGHAHHQAAITYGRLADRHANVAIEISRERAKAGETGEFDELTSAVDIPAKAATDPTKTSSRDDDDMSSDPTLEPLGHDDEVPMDLFKKDVDP